VTKMGLMDKFKKKEPSTIEHDITDSQLEAKAGIKSLKRAEQTDNRIKWTDESLIDEINFVGEQISRLLAKPKRTQKDAILLTLLMKKYSLLEARRHNSKVGVPFSGAGENRPMSENYSGEEFLNACNEGFIEFDDLLKAMNNYHVKISFMPIHGEPADVVLINTPAIIQPGGGRPQQPLSVESLEMLIMKMQQEGKLK